MALSEKLYALRKKSGLSQEQLAEQLNVSRQAISKWESGRSVPESDKLLAISQYFQVSLDYLMKEDVNSLPDSRRETVLRNAGRVKWAVGLLLCIGGIVCLILWGIASLTNPAVSKEISDSSVIRLDGNSIFLLLCIAAVLFGAGLLLNHAAKK